MLKQLARSIVRRYPAAWRERYEEEVLDLLDSAPVRVYDVGELIRNMLVEQVRAMVDIERPSEAAAKVMRYKALCVAAFVALTQAAGWALSWTRTLSDNDRDRLAVYVMSFYGTLAAVWCVHKLRQRGKALDARSPFPAAIALLCLPLHLIGSACWVWGQLSGTSSAPRWLEISQAIYHSLYVGGPIAAWLMMQVWPGQRLVQLLTEFQQADGAVEGAKHYIASCEEWIEKGVMSPLADARKALDERIRERDAIRERLERFRNRSVPRLSP